MKKIFEPAHEINVSGSYDVVVCGSGPAGVTAALSAARSGASVALIESNGCLGGIWTSGLLGLMFEVRNKPGILSEYVDALRARDALTPEFSGEHSAFAYDPEPFKVILDEMCVKAGIRIRLHTRAVNVVKDGDRHISAVITESKSGREAFLAKMYIDATGDGDIGFHAGAGFDLGNPEDGGLQPMTLISIVTGIDRKACEQFVVGSKRGSERWNAKQALKQEMERGGVSPSYAAPVLQDIGHGLFILAAHHAYGVKGTDADDVTRATIEGRREIYAVVDALRSLGGIWSGLRIVTTAEHIGVREGRRLHGLYTMTADDLYNGTYFPDNVCRIGFGIDVHSTNPAASKTFSAMNSRKTKPYTVPFRALVSKDIDNLMMAGRCISGDFISHSSYRVVGAAASMGEATGFAAAACAGKGIDPKDFVGEFTLRYPYRVKE